MRVGFASFLFLSTFLYGESMQSIDSLLQSSQAKYYNGSHYQLKQGLNLLYAPNEGISVEKTFDNTSIRLVQAYYKHAKLQATYSPSGLHKKGTLYLRYIEAQTPFAVVSKEALKIEIYSYRIEGICKKMQEDANYSYVIDSGKEKRFSISKDGSIALQSRYYSHHDRGIYNDTRVAILFPHLDNVSAKRVFTYGPVEPKVVIKYTKEYEGKRFYMYDFKDKKCYLGVFPSQKMPPFAILKQL